uniref:Uncharacterized protein n=1 Tax=Anguilla anguilla TaxID=7936 RepID=A0A0E9S8T2_ANGAN
MQSQPTPQSLPSLASLRTAAVNHAACKRTA